ncbi:helix-turn-helix domain-containing protein [Flavivirga jejuensis]|uniref:Helix-turn-helix domain-containing protein n=1 Tax=Flavivirga jejuensis TaxID=870487 RepID=A0ABT8WV86_9FLAO|nr:helix-turn-helix domain-containing protein [Flavivirga jejuensis]MDO5977078.1 helix-turn-helix domain-containing protein [Flavivirga jejuensis]
MEKLILTQVTVNELLESLIKNLLPRLEKIILSSKEEGIKEYLTSEEVAELCNIKSLSTLWNWKEKNVLVPTARAGRKPLYKYQDVIDYLENKSIDQ